MDEWLSIEPEQAVREMIRRYLRAYGPATTEDFARWCWDRGGKKEARQLFASMKDELEEVDVEGWRAVALGARMGMMQRLEPAETIHLLPLFDDLRVIGFCVTQSFNSFQALFHHCVLR